MRRRPLIGVGGPADRAAAAVAWAVALGVAGVFGWIIWDLVAGGFGQLSWGFLTGPVSSAGRKGGIGPVLVATGLILSVCIGVSLPLGLGAAIFLSEHGSGTGPFARLVRRSLDVLAGVPSIVFGLFGNVFFCQVLGMGFSILSGGLTLACMVLPIFIRSAEVGLRAVPLEQRHASAALALSRSTTLVKVLLPAALPGLTVGLVLGVGRAAAETAALIFTSGYVARMPESLYDSGRALSIHIYDLSMNVPGGDANAYASALTLVVLLLVINLAASLISSRFLRSGIVNV